MAGNNEESAKNKNLIHSRLDLDSPRWDQSHYIGRLKHFFTSANPLNIFYSDAVLESSKKLIDAYKYIRIYYNRVIRYIFI